MDIQAENTCFNYVILLENGKDFSFQRLELGGEFHCEENEREPVMKIFLVMFINPKEICLFVEEEIKKWLNLARNDFHAAEDSIKSKHFDWASFQLQQAVEKALKALLLKKEKKLVKTHDLVFLGQQVGLPEKFLDSCKELTGIYLFVRYPDAGEINELQEKTMKYLHLTVEVLQWIEKKLL